MQEFMTKVNEAKVEYYKQKEYLENRIEFRQQQIAFRQPCCHFEHSSQFRGDDSRRCSG